MEIQLRMQQNSGKILNFLICRFDYNYIESYNLLITKEFEGFKSGYESSRIFLT
jgi:hypothetical protein